MPRPDLSLSFDDCDVSSVAPIWKPHGSNSTDQERAAKRQRIEDCARQYLRGEPLHLQSAALRGPFDKSWRNPWKSHGALVPEEKAKAAKTVIAKPSRAKRDAGPKRAPHPKTTKTVTTKAKTNISKPRGKKPTSATALSELPLKYGDESWLKRGPKQTVTPDDPDPEPALPEMSPSKPSSTSRRTRSIKGTWALKSRPLQKERRSRKQMPPRQHQLQLMALTKPSSQSVSKNDQANVDEQLLDPTVEPTTPLKPVPSSKTTNNDVRYSIEKSLARIRDKLRPPEMKTQGRKRRYMTFNSPVDGAKENPRKRKEANVQKPNELIALGEPSDNAIDLVDDPITETPALSKPIKATHAVEQQPEVPPLGVQAIAAQAIAQVAWPSRDHFSAPTNTPTPPSPSGPPPGEDNAHTSRSGIIIDDPHTAGAHGDNVDHESHEQYIEPAQLIRNDSETTNPIRVPSFPERQDSKAYSPATYEMTTQAALFQAQNAFQTEYEAADTESQFKYPLPSPLLARLPGQKMWHEEAKLTPFRALNRQSLGIGSTQDLMAAAQGVAFSASKTVKKSKRACFAARPTFAADTGDEPVNRSPSKSRLSPPAGSDENRNPNPQITEAAKPCHASQPHRSALKPLREPSSQSNSQPISTSGSANAAGSVSKLTDPGDIPLPTVSFLPSVPLSNDEALGVPAASWQVGQGQRIESEANLTVDLDLERSLDEAVEFLGVDWEIG